VNTSVIVLIRILF